MPTATISDVLRQQNIGSTLEVKGWVRTFRSNRFIALNDGSCQGNVQCVVDFESFSEVLLKRVTTGASISLFVLALPNAAVCADYLRRVPER